MPKLNKSKSDLKRLCLRPKQHTFLSAIYLKKELIIPQLYNSYNYNIRAVNKHNNIASRNAGLKQIVREGY
jgi:hypothetical protein